ncbi:unnamed protein product [Phytomonas sp. Hart1]|nr:unnamed protein product [Phytomonas sp. Hart1]|eukprot:CCW65965.1 unnamed protein product [Phytomonas sp. isolate Hart1]
MFSHIRLHLRPRTMHPKAFMTDLNPEAMALRASLTSMQKKLQKPAILQDLDASIPLQMGDHVVRARSLWNFSVVARGNKHARRSQGVCVVGGAKAIRRIWRDYRVPPNVVYVPNTEPEVPSWCLEESLPSFIVRCPPVEVKKNLLSAEYSDGYAAEFPWHPSQLSPAASLFSEDHTAGEDFAATGDDAAAASPYDRRDARLIRSMLVLVGLRIPSNVGMLLRAAVDLKYDSVLLINSVDPFQEKVVRASEGAAFSPRMQLFEMPDTASCVSLLSNVALRHHLLPLIAVPSQGVKQAFEVAKHFHVHNARQRQRVHAALTSSIPAGVLGPMLILGSESGGLRGLDDGEWGLPYQLLTLPLPNTIVDSHNVTVSGSILLNLFRPDAEAHFMECVAITGECLSSEKTNVPFWAEPEEVPHLSEN